MRHRGFDFSLDVGQNAEVLFDPREELRGLPGPRERLEKMLARLLQLAGPQIQPAERIERFGGEKIVPLFAGDAIAAIAEIPRRRRLVAVMAHDGEPPQCLGQYRTLAGSLGGHDGGFETLDRLWNACRPFTGACFVQQIGRRSTRQPHIPRSG